MLVNSKLGPLVAAVVLAVLAVLELQQHYLNEVSLPLIVVQSGLPQLIPKDLLQIAIENVDFRSMGHFFESLNKQVQILADEALLVLLVFDRLNLDRLPEG